MLRHSDLKRKTADSQGMRLPVATPGTKAALFPIPVSGRGLFLVLLLVLLEGFPRDLAGQPLQESGC